MNVQTDAKKKIVLKWRQKEKMFEHTHKKKTNECKRVAP